MKIWSFGNDVLLIAVALGCLGAPRPARAELPTEDGIGMAFRSIDLAPGQFVSVSGDHCNLTPSECLALPKGRDLAVVRQRDNGNWSGGTADGATTDACSGGTLADCDVYGTNLSYGRPVYAPVDGVVASCWRNHPNSPPNGPHPLRCCGGLVTADGSRCLFENDDGTSVACDSGRCQRFLDECDPSVCPPDATDACPITRSGNHVVLVTDDDHGVLLAHLAPGTIPERLCPLDDEFMVDANVHAPCNDCEAPVESVIPPDERPRVRRGDFLGRLGTSGASGGPHLHVHVNEVSTTNAGDIRNVANVFLRIVNAWVRPRNDVDGWTKLAGDQFPVDDGTTILHPAPFLRRDEAAGDGIRQIETTDSAVTVARRSDDRMELRSWDVDADGEIAPEDQLVTDGSVGDVAVARPGNGRNVVTAVRAANDELKLTFWRVADGGAIERADDDTSGGKAGDVSLASYPVGRGVVSAVQADSGELKLTAWNVDERDQLVRRGSATGGAVRAVELATLAKGRRASEAGVSPFRGVVTAAKNEAGVLRVTTWRFDPSTGSLSQASSLGAGAITGQIAVAAVPAESFREMVVVAARSTTGMRLLSFEVAANGALTKRWEWNLGGEAKEITVDAVSEGRFLTALQDGSGRLRLIGWHLGPNGKLTRLGEEQAGAADRVASALLRRDGGDTLLALTAVRGSNGALQLISYDTNL
jgi:hypothetical protein